jgi:two-component system OmpR family response regulator
VNGLRSKVLIVGCRPQVGINLCLRLREDAFAVVAQSFADVDETIDVFQPDLIVSALSNDDAMRCLTELRNATGVPVIVVAPSDCTQATRIRAFHAGADDVITESLDIEELVLRVVARLRRSHVPPSIEVDDVVIDVAGRSAWRGGHLLDLTHTEFLLLAALAHQPGVVISKRKLLESVWGFEGFDVNLVEVQVSALRKKLEEFGTRIIQTVRLHGYVIRDSPLSHGSTHSTATASGSSQHRCELTRRHPALMLQART